MTTSSLTPFHMSPIGMSHGTHRNEWWHTFEWVMAYIGIRHGTRRNDSNTLSHVCRLAGTLSQHPYSYLMSHITDLNDSFTSIQSLIPFFMSHFGMSHATHRNESWHTCKCVMAHIWMSHVTHLNESNTLSHAGHLEGTLSQQPCSYKNESCNTYEWAMSHTWIRHVTHVYESWHTHERIISHTWMNYIGPFGGNSDLKPL